jgi:hypothetical protein
MFPRLAAALLLCVALTACKQDDNNAPVGQTLFAGIGDVRVIDARIVPTSDSSAQTSGGTLSYLIAHVELTNGSRSDFTPQVDHFYYIDRDGNRFQAKDSGSSVFIGVSNSQLVLKQNDKRIYTIGFRTTDPSTSGTISYDL